MLYTRKGDAGESGLFGTKERFPKDGLAYEALGTLDELNSLLGFCRARAMRETQMGSVVHAEISRAQQNLFIIQAEVTGSDRSIPVSKIYELERSIDGFEKVLEPRKGFVVPGATELSSLLDYARAVSRRTERTAVRMSRERTISSPALAYLNRLSSLLYALARYAASQERVKEMAPLHT